MSRRWINYSILAAIVITAISYAMFRQGGEYLLWPGLFVQVMFNGLLLLAIPTGDDYYTLPSEAYLAFSVVFYSFIVFIALFLFSRIRSKRNR